VAHTLKCIFIPDEVKLLSGIQNERLGIYVSDLYNVVQRTEKKRKTSNRFDLPQKKNYLGFG
jgi:hypothetical protein